LPKHQLKGNIAVPDIRTILTSIGRVRREVGPVGIRIAVGDVEWVPPSYSASSTFLFLATAQ